MGIGKNYKRPFMALLVGNQPRRIREGNNHDRNATPVEFSFMCLHLAEVCLTWQSGKMSQKYQENVAPEKPAKIDSAAVQIKQAQAVNGNLNHGIRG
jgi:hypothetical protein